MTIASVSPSTTRSMTRTTFGSADRGQDPPFLDEPGHDLGIRHKLRPEHLDCHRVAGLPDAPGEHLAHRAAAQWLVQDVPATERLIHALSSAPRIARPASSRSQAAGRYRPARHLHGGDPPVADQRAAQRGARAMTAAGSRAPSALPSAGLDGSSTSPHLLLASSGTSPRSTEDAVRRSSGEQPAVPLSRIRR